jgi:hypothetical protein
LNSIDSSTKTKIEAVPVQNQAQIAPDSGDSELSRVVVAWPSLTPEQRAAIISIIEPL